MVDITNYYERQKSLLAGQFQDNPAVGEITNLQKLIKALAVSQQEIQTQLTNLQNNRSLKTAQGVQLDGLGQIIGLARIPGQDDADYREALIFQSYANTYSGTPENVIAAAQFFTDANKIWYVDLFPAAYELISDGVEDSYPANPSTIVSAIQTISPAGVEFSALIATYNTNPFVFSSDPIVEPFYVAPDPDDTSLAVQLEVNATDFLYANAGNTIDPNFGGHFAEFGNPINTVGAGQLTEAIMLNGNIPPGP